MKLRTADLIFEEGFVLFQVNAHDIFAATTITYFSKGRFMTLRKITVFFFALAFFAGGTPLHHVQAVPSWCQNWCIRELNSCMAHMGQYGDEDEYEFCIRFFNDCMDWCEREGL